MNARRTDAATIAVIAVIIASCGFPQQERAEAIPDDQIPVALRQDVGSTTTTLVATDVIAVWFIRDGTLERRAAPGEGPRHRNLCDRGVGRGTGRARRRHFDADRHRRRRRRRRRA